MLPEYSGVLTANPIDDVFISNKVKRKHAYFDIVLKSNGQDLLFEKVKDCFVFEISYNSDTPEFKFHVMAALNSIL